MNGIVSILNGICLGVIAFSLEHGHFAYGGGDITIDGQTIRVDMRRLTGINHNAVMRIEPSQNKTCLLDTVSGNAVYYDTQVTLQKVYG